MGSSSADPVTPSNQDKWDSGQNAGGPGSDPIGGPGEHPNGSSADDHLGVPGESGSIDYAQHPTGNGVGHDQDGLSGGEGRGSSYRGEKQIKPNKVYIGGLPEHTRKEDLESCFGKIGAIVNVELKLGYGFVEFESKEAAEESVAKYHEGFFMGNKIRVELSHGGGRTAKYNGEPGACFKCGQQGHWARECPNHGGNMRRGAHHHNDAPLIDRIQPSKEYPPPRDYPSYRGDDFSRNYPPQRDRYYDYAPPPPTRDYRRPATPPRDYPPGPPPRRDYDDYRMRGPPARYDARSYYPESDGQAAYPPNRNYPPPRDNYERRGPPPERYPPYPPPGRRSPPPPRGRDDFDRPPPRDYPPRAMSPRSFDYPPRPNPDGPPNSRYRRRSQSPPPRSSSSAYDTGYQGGAGGPPYSGGPPSGYSGGNGYPGNNPPRSAGGARDYPPRASRDNAEPPPGYRRL